MDFLGPDEDQSGTIGNAMPQHGDFTRRKLIADSSAAAAVAAMLVALLAATLVRPADMACRPSFAKENSLPGDLT